MRWGLIARADDRGLSHLTWEMARNLRPDVILLVDMEDPRFGTYHDRYDGLANVVVEWSYPRGDRSLDAHRWLDGLDLVFSAETFYGLDHTIAKAGVRTINYVMPEFYRAEDPRPTATWLPTPWLSEFIPWDEILPLPCPSDRWFKEQTPFRRQHNDRLRVVMPAGNGAMHDRNGARIFLRALRFVTEPIQVTVWTQDRSFPIESRMSRSVNYTLARRAADYWQIPRGAHLVVIPRRYGGLCLPAIEALGAGAALAMTGCPPNHLWPMEPIGCHPGLAVTCPFGEAPTFDAEPRDVARLLDRFAADPELTRKRQEEARDWAENNSWTARRDQWRSLLEEVAKR